MTPNITGPELRAYMEEKHLTLAEMGNLLGGKAATTVMRWLDGQEIPGDTQLLLKLLIRGEMPFQEESVPSQVREAMWELEMSLGTWEEINRRRVMGGFATVTDWIASLVREKLTAPVPTKDRGWDAGDTRTVGHAAADEMALLSEAPPSPAGDAADELLGAAALAFADENPAPPPPPAAAPAGAAAGGGGSARAPGAGRGKPLRVRTNISKRTR